jgi:hypothetical protein
MLRTMAAVSLIRASFEEGVEGPFALNSPIGKRHKRKKSRRGW